MSIAAVTVMDADEFLLWCLDQEGRFELVDGVVEMMAGANRLHDRIVVNIIIALGNQLGSGPCHPTTADTGLRTRIRSVRRPDVMVTCDPPKPGLYEALDPRLAVEVLSKSNTGMAWERKLKEYRRHEKLQYILLVDSEVAIVTILERTKTGWDLSDRESLLDVVDLPKIKCRLSLAEIYANTGINDLPQADNTNHTEFPET
jgi:Uma2 family endonuclease